MEEYFNKPLYKLRQEWKEMLTEQSLIQDMQRKVASNIPNLTPSDMRNTAKKPRRGFSPLYPHNIASVR